MKISRALNIATMTFCFLYGVASSTVSFAHHSAVVFDTTKAILQTGTVTQFIYRNPHLIIQLEVTDEEGNINSWNIEGQSIAVMERMGFNRASIEIGDEITMKIYPLKSGKFGGLVEGLIGADGRAYNMEAPETRLVYPALMEWVPPPSGETWQQREAKTRPPQLPIDSGGGAGALDPSVLPPPQDGVPFDLTGLWSFRGEDQWRANYGSFEFKPKPELTPKAQSFMDAYLQASERGERFGDPTVLCYPPGMPRFMTRYGAIAVMQYPSVIYMVSRLNNDYRVIYLDGRERKSDGDLDRNWMGESIGRWEGDTLVVETTGFIGENHLMQAGVLASQQLKIVERFRLINDGNTLVIEFTFTDPENWEGEWTHVKFRDRIVGANADVREANCIFTDNQTLPGMD
jgi:hypothetical protein